MIVDVVLRTVNVIVDVVLKNHVMAWAMEVEWLATSVLLAMHVEVMMFQVELGEGMVLQVERQWKMGHVVL